MLFAENLPQRGFRNDAVIDGAQKLIRHPQKSARVSKHADSGPTESVRSAIQGKVSDTYSWKTRSCAGYQVVHASTTVYPVGVQPPNRRRGERSPPGLSADADYARPPLQEGGYRRIVTAPIPVPTRRSPLCPDQLPDRPQARRQLW